MLNNQYHIGILPGQCNSLTGFDLGEHLTQDGIINQITQREPMAPDPALLITKIRENFKHYNENVGRRQSQFTRRIGILFLDEEPQPSSDILEETRSAEQEGIELILVSIGDVPVVKNMTDSHQSHHLIQIDKYDNLKHTVIVISRILSYCSQQM